MGADAIDSLTIKIMSETQPPEHRLSVFYLLCLSAGVGIAISVTRAIEQLRATADSHYHGSVSPEMGIYSTLVSAIYGVCVITFIFAWRSRDLWSSPGKTLAFVFSAMCIFDWALELVAAVVMHQRMQVEWPSGTVPDTRGFIAGIWYRNLAPSVGYVFGLPILALVIAKTRSQGLLWRLVWIGFFIFSALLVGSIHFGIDRYLPTEIQFWYFEIAIGLPIWLLALALIVTLARGKRVDWWTTITAPLIITVWIVLVTVKAASF